VIVEWLLVTSLLAGASVFLAGRWTTFRVRLWIALFAASGLLLVWQWQRHLEKKRNSRAQLIAPQVGRPEAYSSSAACRACHPDQYASWHSSFHRTMTQVASPDSVRGTFDDVTLELDGDVYHLERRGDEYWVELTDPDWKLRQESTPQPDHSSSKPPRVRRRVSLVTGSHHMQAYWVDNKHGNQQYSLPFTYLFEQERWVPRRSVFLKDPKDLHWNQLWNVGCIDCHSTGGQPRQKEIPGDFDTRVAELGIACEACHGPARQHVRLNSDPRRRYAAHFQKEGDPSIVNPRRLNSKRSSEVCGACHSIHFPRDQEDWLRNGLDFHPGENLEAKVQVPSLPKSLELRRGSFWSDGMVRVSGREYNGLVKTPCFQKGTMSCLSCHSMHESSPTNQVAIGMESNAACVQCHSTLAKDLTQHTHHSAGSSGSLCYNCHMPYTTYGLLKALRSHQISNPSVQASLQTGRPNACNLCHLDKTLAWTAQNLSKWYGIPAENLSPEESAIAASILWALKGDAGQRALIAWHLGWKPAQEASNASWFPPYLAPLLEDPYPAVRYIAGRSLQRLPGYETFSYDFVAASEDLHRSSQRALEIWTRTAKPFASASLLIGKDGRPDREAVEALLKSRNNRVVELFE
jgi:predicted CXXCH cytochrome family protein